VLVAQTAKQRATDLCFDVRRDVPQTQQPPIGRGLAALYKNDACDTRRRDRGEMAGEQCGIAERAERDALHAECSQNHVDVSDERIYRQARDASFG